jgi:hypothetical protein
MRQDWFVNHDTLLAFWKSGGPISNFFPDSKSWLLDRGDPDSPPWAEQKVPVFAENPAAPALKREAERIGGGDNLWHRTSADSAAAILRDGFRDWLSDEVLTPNEGPAGDTATHAGLQ